MSLIPETKVQTTERCSGHGGSWGLYKENFQDALDVGKPAMKRILGERNPFVTSECPLAAMHLKQGITRLEKHNPGMQHKDDEDRSKHDKPKVTNAQFQTSSVQTKQNFLHPVELMALSWRL